MFDNRSKDIDLYVSKLNYASSSPTYIGQIDKCTKPGNNLGQNNPQGTDLHIELPHSLDAQNHDDGGNDQNDHVDQQDEKHDCAHGNDDNLACIYICHQQGCKGHL